MADTMRVLDMRFRFDDGLWRWGVLRLDECDGRWRAFVDGVAVGWGSTPSVALRKLRRALLKEAERVDRQAQSLVLDAGRQCTRLARWASRIPESPHA
jgi:hypothetical protein